MREIHLKKAHRKHRIRQTNRTLTLMLLVTNLANTKGCQKAKKMTETLAHGYSPESTEREPYDETNMTWLI